MGSFQQSDQIPDKNPHMGKPMRIKKKKMSLELVFETEETPLLRFACGITRQREVAEDIVQEAFLKLHKHWDTVENPRAWLYRATRNLAINYIRDHKREISLPEEGEVEESNETLPSDQLGRMETVGLVRLLLAELDEEDQQLIRLKYHEECTYQKISDQLGMGVGNVGYRLHHLLKNLADGLRNIGVDGSKG